MVEFVVADFAQAVVVVDREVVHFGGGLGGFAGAAHGTTVNCVHVAQVAWEPCAEEVGLFLAEIGEGRVDVAVGPFFEVDVALSVTDHVEVHNDSFYYELGGDCIIETGRFPPTRMTTMNHTETIASQMALYQQYPDIQLAQTAVRQEIVAVWQIPSGARVLEIGCGQGDMTAVLADAVGPAGHVVACDVASPDYGAPITLGESTDYLQQSPLGSRITFKLGYDVLAKANTFPANSFDYVVLAHCLWYFDSQERLQQTFEQVRTWADTLCLSEWDLQPQTIAQLAHLLAVIVQGQVTAFDADSTANIRTLLTPAVLTQLLAVTGWSVETTAVIDSSGLQDGGWEIAESGRATATAVALGLPTRFVHFLEAQVDLMQALAAAHGRQSLPSLAIRAGWRE